MQCPKCGHTWKDEGRAKGGQKSKRKITPEQQKKMQAGRLKMKSASTWDCDENPQKKIKKGTTVVLPYVWSWVGHEMTPHKDVEVVLEKDSKLIDALCLVEAAALEFVMGHGAKEIRHYFIEGVEFTAGRVEFVLGT